MDIINTTEHRNHPPVAFDRDAARRHIERLVNGASACNGDGLIEIAWQLKSGEFHAKLFPMDEIDKAVQCAEGANANKGVNVYVGAALRKPDTPRNKRTNDDAVLHSNVIWLDFDEEGAAEEALEIARGEGFEPHVVVRTGKTPHVREHFYWMLKEPAGPDALRVYLPRLRVLFPRADASTKNPGRILRLAGSVAWPRKAGRVVEGVAMPVDDPSVPVALDDLEAKLPPLAGSSPPCGVVGGDSDGPHECDPELVALIEALPPEDFASSAGPYVATVLDDEPAKSLSRSAWLATMGRWGRLMGDPALEALRDWSKQDDRPPEKGYPGDAEFDKAFHSLGPWSPSLGSNAHPAKALQQAQDAGLDLAPLFDKAFGRPAADGSGRTVDGRTVLLEEERSVWAVRAEQASPGAQDAVVDDEDVDDGAPSASADASSEDPFDPSDPSEEDVETLVDRALIRLRTVVVIDDGTDEQTELRRKRLRKIARGALKVTPGVARELGVHRFGASPVSAPVQITPAEADNAARLAFGSLRKGRELKKSKKAGIVNDELNVKKALECAFGTAIALDDLRGAIVVRRAVPWDEPGEKYPREWKDTDGTNAVMWFQQNGFRAIKSHTVEKVVPAIAEAKRFQPVKDYLESLQWDGTPRLASAHYDYFGYIDDTDPHHPRSNELPGIFIKKWMMSGVARTYEPGCKADAMLILQGAQGIGKSSALRTLALRDEWFKDDLKGLGTKEAQQGLLGRFIVEFSELDAFNKHDMSIVKSYITTAVDQFRPPYGKNDKILPRRCIFAGTTNNEEFLRDPTGGRRFYPVCCGSKIDLDALKRDRDQLWAEAVHSYKSREKWWIDEDPELVAAAQLEQSSRQIEDVWEDIVYKALNNKNEINPNTRKHYAYESMLTASEIFWAIGFDPVNNLRGSETRLGNVMKRLGWERKRVSRDGVRRWCYIRPDPQPDPQPDTAAPPQPHEAGHEAGRHEPVPVPVADLSEIAEVGPRPPRPDSAPTADGAPSHRSP